MKLESTELFQDTNHKITKDSYTDALVVAKQKKPHTISETLVKSYVLKMVEIVLRNGLEKKMRFMRCALSKISPQIMGSVSKKRSQISY